MTSSLWNVRGVAEERRRQAKSAAAAMGQTLGKWLEDAIYALAIEQGLARGEAKGGVGEGPKISEKPEVGTGTIERIARADDFVAEQANPVPPEVKNPPDEISSPPKKRRASVKKVCRHGTEKGYNCWQCGGLAAVE